LPAVLPRFTVATFTVTVAFTVSVTLLPRTVHFTDFVHLHCDCSTVYRSSLPLTLNCVSLPPAFCGYGADAVTACYVADYVIAFCHLPRSAVAIVPALPRSPLPQVPARYRDYRSLPELPLPAVTVTDVGWRTLFCVCLFTLMRLLRVLRLPALHVAVTNLPALPFIYRCRLFPVTAAFLPFYALITVTVAVTRCSVITVIAPRLPPAFYLAAFCLLPLPLITLHHTCGYCVTCTVALPPYWHLPLLITRFCGFFCRYLPFWFRLHLPAALCLRFTVPLPTTLLRSPDVSFHCRCRSYTVLDYVLRVFYRLLLRFVTAFLPDSAATRFRFLPFTCFRSCRSGLRCLVLPRSFCARICVTFTVTAIC